MPFVVIISSHPHMVLSTRPTDRIHLYRVWDTLPDDAEPVVFDTEKETEAYVLNGFSELEEVDYE